MGKKRRQKENHQERVQDNCQSNEKCCNCFQSITNLIIVLIIMQFICMTLEEK